MRIDSEETDGDELFVRAADEGASGCIIQSAIQSEFENDVRTIRRSWTCKLRRLSNADRRSNFDLFLSVPKRVDW